MLKGTRAHFGLIRGCKRQEHDLRSVGQLPQLSLQRNLRWQKSAARTLSRNYRRTLPREDESVVSKLLETRVSQTEELTLKDENLIAKTRWDLCLKIREPCLAITGEPCLTMGRGILSLACVGRVNEETENTDNVSKITDNISLLGCACNFNLQMKLLLLS